MMNTYLGKTLNKSALTNFVFELIKSSLFDFTIDDQTILEALEDVKKDVELTFHSEVSESDIILRIISNSNELPIFLYRLGRRLLERDENDFRLKVLHGIMRKWCGCEIYFNNQIGEGFYIVHGLGTIIGSRNVIGKMFRIHQNCTVGHRKNGIGKSSGKGNVIGNNVTMYAESKIIGELKIGDNVIIGLGKAVFNDVPPNCVVK